MPKRPKTTQTHDLSRRPDQPPAMEPLLHHLLALFMLPGTLTTEQFAQRIGCHLDDIPCLQGLPMPLGNPGEEAVKRYLTREVLELLEDRERMDRFWNAIYRRNRQRNLPPAQKCPAQGPGAFRTNHGISLSTTPSTG